MFKKALMNASDFSRPIITAKKIWGNDKLINDANVLLVLNNEGDLLTTRDVGELFIRADETEDVFNNIFEEIKNGNPKKLDKIKKKYGITDETITNICNQIINVSPDIKNVEIFFHDYLNLALIRLHLKNVNVDNFPVFNKSIILQGEAVCGSGFAFPEYKAFEYDNDSYSINITNSFMSFPMFPITGIVARNILDTKNNVSMFEFSHDVYPGMQGAAVLNTNGEVLGMMIGNKVFNIADKNTVKVGVAINSYAICEFLDNNKIKYNVVKGKKND